MNEGFQKDSMINVGKDNAPISEVIEEISTENEEFKHPEHLKKDVKPIMACVGSPKNFRESPEDAPHINNNFGLKNPEDIVWGAYGDNNEEFLNAGFLTYVISPVDSLDKISQGFHLCTGLIVAGITYTGKKVSFLTHQPGGRTIHLKDDKFIFDLEQQLTKIRDVCKSGTIDAVIIGGQYFAGIKEKYLDITKILGMEVQKFLGFEPTIINGPKMSPHKTDDVYFDNENRRLYFVRGKVNTKAKDFLPSKFK